MSIKLKLKARKEWRLQKYGMIPVESMSSTTRKLFKQWGHRSEEIRYFENERRKR